MSRKPSASRRGERVVVNDVQRIVRLLHMQPRDRAPGAADQIERFGRAAARSTGGRGERSIDRVDDGLGGCRRARQGAAAPSGRLTPAPIAGFAVAAPSTAHQLDAAAAQIADDAVGVRNAGEDPGGR